MEKLVVTEKRGASGIIRMNDAKHLNQLSSDMMLALEEALIWARDQGDVEQVILTGGPVFCAGARIHELYEVAQTRDAAKIRAFISKANQIASLAENIGKPTVAVINKHCFGGGNELAMACTFRIAHEETVFGQQEIKHGIMPGMGGTQRLPRLIGIAKAMPILLTGDTFAAGYAQEIGLIWDSLPSENLLVEVESMRGQDRFLMIPMNAHYSISKQHAVSAEKVDAEMDQFLRSATYQNIMKVTQFPEACSAIIQAVREGLKRPLREGLEIEQEWFVKIMMTDSAQQGLKRTIERLAMKKQ